MLAFAAISLLANDAGEALRYPRLGAAILFAPYAVLTVALVFARRRDWLWFILVSAAAHVATHWPDHPLGWTAVAEVANVTRALLAAWLLRRLFADDVRLNSVPILCGFVLVVAAIAPAAGAAIGTLNVLLYPRTSYAEAWTGWFLSNSLTGLTILPTMLLGVAATRNWRRVRAHPARVAEACACVAALTCTTAFAFLMDGAQRWQLAMWLYAPLPALIWIALRFGTFAASASLSLVTVAGVMSADRGLGPFLHYSTDDNIVVLQMFAILTSLPVLCIAAVGSARQTIVELHRAFLASLRDNVAIVDARGVIIAANDAWRACAVSTGMAGVGDNFVDDSRAAARANPSTVASCIVEGLLRVLHREQARFDLEWDELPDCVPKHLALSIQALARVDGGAVVTYADVTASHQANIELQQQRVELSHLARVAALGQLSGSLAHELNQPLTSIGANAEAGRLLLQRRDVDTTELDGILSDILTEDRRAVQVIRRLRALLKRGEAKIQPISGDELIAEVLALARP
ncbi:MAG TPA: MASE1 domain-containing protein, partial [Gemmatimonadaceae bacterium]|nr:MASE1 domain-containing protein [Gemmatimonadaceae bacterium]